MTATDAHRQLVGEIVRWISARLDLPLGLALYVDHLGVADSARPPVIGTSIPDVFATCAASGLVLIGEAKTKNDIENAHCRRQLCDFLVFLSSCPRAHLILAVPWQCAHQMRSLARLLQKRTGTGHVPVTILEQLP